MDLLIANNVNVKGMKELMEVLQKEGDLPNSLSFFSSHPLTGERIKSANQYLRDNHQKQTERIDLKEIFEELKN
jgi:predicted Zn-dependent protease